MSRFNPHIAAATTILGRAKNRRLFAAGETLNVLAYWTRGGELFYADSRRPTSPYRKVAKGVIRYLVRVKPKNVGA